jgi:hypothetical protein
MKTQEEMELMDECLAKELAEDRNKRLEMMRVRNIACITAGCAVSDLNKEASKSIVARLLIMTYLLGKGFATVDVTKASTIAKKDIDAQLERYYKIKERSAQFREMEASFLKKIDICCAKV